jgi:molecular chaperone Hsp33
MTDILDRFLFENRPLRGEIVSIEKSFQGILASSDYPISVQELLGELMVAASLLTATLKFEGEIALQIQSEGPLRYAVINGTHEQKLRGVARWNDEVEAFPTSFNELFVNGVLAITLTPKEGQRYQGMVALDKDSLSACIEDYFLQSEQLLTKVKLMTELGANPKAAGLLIQIVPTTSETMNVASNEDFEHAAHLAETVTQKEIFSLSHKDMIYRLYHEDVIRIFEPKDVTFFCDCSKQRSAQALKSVAKQELLNIIEEDGFISMDCQFCHAKYDFDLIDVENIHRQNLDSGLA